MVFEIDNYDSLQQAVEKVSQFLAGFNVPAEKMFDARLVISELVGNVLRHAKTTATLDVQMDGGFVEMHVYSALPFTPPLVSKKVEVFAESGRGLFLVDSVSEERFSTKEGGTLVRIRIER